MKIAAQLLLYALLLLSVEVWGEADAANTTAADRDEALFALLQNGPTDARVQTFGDRSNTTSIRRRLGSQYMSACSSPALLYDGTGTSGKCICDEEFEQVHRLLCMVDGATCTHDICTEERDIWVFSRESGNLVSRSTCVVCVDDAAICANYDDVCFNSDFNGDREITSCEVTLQDTDPVISCTNCRPCQNEKEEWGMEFDCFEGRWDTRGTCVSESRVGHFPDFPSEWEFVDTGVVDTIYTERNREEKGYSYQLTAIIIGVAIALGLLIGIVGALCTGTDVPPMEDVVTEELDKAQSSEKDTSKSADKDNGRLGIAEIAAASASSSEQ